jgi:hypothetical protein
VVYDRERERRNDAVVAAHKEALVRGDKRVLRVTTTGELHSYAADEIGFSPGRGHAQVSTWWGMGILCAFSLLMFLFSWVILLIPVTHGEGPYWGALFLMVLAGLFAGYSFGLARAEYRATKLRKQRGVPKPGSGYAL